MAERKSKSTKFGDVVYFEYVPNSTDKMDELVYVWDIDKTYLNTNFETLRGLFRTAFEKAFQKINVPGSATLIRALEASYRQKKQTETSEHKNPASLLMPLYFISASPPQMEAKIYQKMRLDGLSPYGIFLKDNLKNLRPSKFRRLKQQVGFKVQSLLELRARTKKKIRMVLFGDDSESDAVVYSLFSDICQRRLPETEILSVLEALHVLPEQRQAILALQSKIEVDDPVDRIYINLVADTDPEYYNKFGRRVFATFTTFQAALDLYQSGRIDLPSLVTVARDMIYNYGFTAEELAKSFTDYERRSSLNAEAKAKIVEALKAQALLPAQFSNLVFNPVKALQKIGEKLLGVSEDPWIPEKIDYLNDFR